jgi:hypothetical protein
MFYFQSEDYEKSHSYFKPLSDYKLLTTANKSELDLYTTDLNGYLIACESMLPKNESKTAPNLEKLDQNTRQVLNKIEHVENLISKSDFIQLYEALMEDNLTRVLSISFRLNLESSLKDKCAKNDLVLDQICSANLVRLLTDSVTFHRQNYDLNKLSCLGQVIRLFWNEITFLIR